MITKEQIEDVGLEDVISFLNRLKDLRTDNGKLNYEDGELPFGTCDYMAIDDMVAKLKKLISDAVDNKSVKPIILDDNVLSIMKYAEEYPENWKKICESIDKKDAEQNSQEICSNCGHEKKNHNHKDGGCSLGGDWEENCTCKKFIRQNKSEVRE